MDTRRVLIEQIVNPRFTTAEGFIVLPKLGTEAVPRDGSISISSVDTPAGKRFFIELSGPAFGLDEEEPALGGVTECDATVLAGYVTDCRKAWHAQIDSDQPTGSWLGGTEKPHQERVTQKKELFDQISRKLAVAGAVLFQQIFLQSTPNMSKVAEHLGKALRGPPCFLTVYSDTFFIPWAMLYVHPTEAPKLGLEGENADPEGFVGYRHVVEQATDAIYTPAAIVPLKEAIAFGFTFDESIDATQGIKSVKQQQAYFEKQNRLNPRAMRKSVADLKKAFVNDGLPDQISYFYLHGLTNNPSQPVNLPAFYLGKEAVSANDLKAWSQWQGREAILSSSPLMVFNACQAGQLRSLFYESFAFMLLDLRARGLLGPQIDIPSVFAEEYARQFFDLLLQSGGSLNAQKPSIDGRVGDIVRSLAREFRDKHNNPLGLVYSLYKGAECYIAWNGRGATNAPTPTH
jgi:hypothetical protein